MKLALLAVSSAALVASSPAQASIDITFSQTTFGTWGGVQQNLNFDSFDPNSATPVSNPYVVGDLSIETDANIVVGKDWVYSLPSNAITSSANTDQLGFNAYVSGNYNLFSFSAGMFSSVGTVNIFVMTSTGYIYNFYGVPIAPERSSEFTFIGLRTDGEYIRQVSARSPLRFGATDFQLGSTNVPAVPEPATWALMLFGFGAIGASMRVRRRARPVPHGA